MSSLLLDAEIRNWVLIPLFVVLFLVGILRHNVVTLINSPKKQTLQQQQDAQIAQRAQLLIANRNSIPQRSFLMRRAGMTVEAAGALTRKRPAASNPMTDPSMMSTMMKNNLSSFGPQVLLMAWINFFFSGFVLVRVPFTLSTRFKTMLQRGVDLPSLDASWVSSLSWYFLCMFGMSGLHSLVLGENNEASQAKAMQKTMPGMGAPAAPGQPVDWNKIFQDLKDHLELADHQYAFAEL